MGLLDSFEKGLERVVSGAFAKTFKSGLQPVEITAALRREYEELAAQSPAEVGRNSPLKARPGTLHLPKYFTLQDVDVWDMSSDARRLAKPAPGRAAELVAGLNARGYWPSPLTTTSNPYIGEAPAAVGRDDADGHHLGVVPQVDAGVPDQALPGAGARGDDGGVAARGVRQFGLVRPAAPRPRAEQDLLEFQDAPQVAGAQRPQPERLVPPGGVHGGAPVRAHGGAHAGTPWMSGRRR